MGDIETGAASLSATERAWIKKQQVNLDDGTVVSYQVNLLITFVLDD